MQLTTFINLVLSLPYSVHWGKFVFISRKIIGATHIGEMSSKYICLEVKITLKKKTKAE